MTGRLPSRGSRKSIMVVSANIAICDGCGFTDSIWPAGAQIGPQMISRRTNDGSAIRADDGSGAGSISRTVEPGPGAPPAGAVAPAAAIWTRMESPAAAAGDGCDLGLAGNARLRRKGRGSGATDRKCQGCAHGCREKQVFAHAGLLAKAWLHGLSLAIYVVNFNDLVSIFASPVQYLSNKRACTAVDRWRQNGATCLHKRNHGANRPEPGIIAKAKIISWTGGERLRPDGTDQRAQFAPLASVACAPSPRRRPPPARAGVSLILLWGSSPHDLEQFGRQRAGRHCICLPWPALGLIGELGGQNDLRAQPPAHTC
jgi:hypothetical protein